MDQIKFISFFFLKVASKLSENRKFDSAVCGYLLLGAKQRHSASRYTLIAEALFMCFQKDCKEGLPRLKYKWGPPGLKSKKGMGFWPLLYDGTGRGLCYFLTLLTVPRNNGAKIITIACIFALDFEATLKGWTSSHLLKFNILYLGNTKKIILFSFSNSL